MKKLSVILLSLVFFWICGATDGFGFTDHRLLVKQDKNGTIFIDSFPDEMNDIPKKSFPHFLICFSRENGVWDGGILAGEVDCSIDKINSAEPKIKALKALIDKILPDDMKVISFSYMLCHHDINIYFEHDYTLEEVCLIAEMLNAERNNYR